MKFFGFILKALLFAILGSGWIDIAPSLAEAISTPEMRTHLVSVDYNPYAYPPSDDSKPLDDSFGQESVKIENRQLYDTVKHASGYDPDAHTNSSRLNADTANDKQNTSSVKISVPPRKSAVIQAIPRKVRGPGGGSSFTSPTSSPFARHPSLHAAAKDYGTGEPTTTIVYATSIPTTASRTYVNIRPVPLLSTQKYRSTLTEAKQEKAQISENQKSVAEKFSDDEEKEEDQQQEQKSQLSVVLEKPAFKGDSDSDQATATPGTYDATPYHLEQRKRNLYKSIPYARIRTNEDIEKLPAYNRNSFVNPYPNHKWTNEDFEQRMPHPPPPPPPSTPPRSQFVYENIQDAQQSFYQPLPNQHAFSPRYPPADEYQDEMYRSMVHPAPIYLPQQQPIASILSQQQQQSQQYQPLTVRDFELLLQLLVLRERRLNAAQDAYQSPSDYSSDGNFYGPNIPANGYFKSRETVLPRPRQQSSVRLLPSNVREELLFRMLLLALHLQPQPKPSPVTRTPPPQYMYLGPASATSPPPPAYLGFRQRNGGLTKNPIRSVQVLGEID